jgi:outer membrane autotransporter protein
MRHPNISSLSSLAVLPSLLLVATSAHAQNINCVPQATPSTVRPGGTISLRGNCVDRDTGLPLTTGVENWSFATEGWSPIGTRTLPNGTLEVTAPTQEGEYLYGIPSVDTGYGGPIFFEGVMRVTVTVDADASTPSPSSSQQLSAPLLTIQTQRVRTSLAQADARMRELRKPPKSDNDKDKNRERRTGFYIGGLVDYLRQKADGSQSEFDSRTTSLSLGGDHRINDDWVVGGSLGRSDGRVAFAGSSSRQETAGTNLTTYASWSLTPTTYVTATLSYEATRFDLTRDEQGSLSFAAPRGKGVGFSVSAGRDFVFGPVTLGPYVRIDNVTSRVDAFSETGDVTAASVSAQRTRSNSFNLGAQTQMAVPVEWGIVLPFVRAEISQRRDAVKQAPTATLIDGTTPLLVPTSADTQDGFGTLAIGVSGVNTGGLSWFADLETGVGQKGYRTRRLGFGLRSEF